MDTKIKLLIFLLFTCLSVFGQEPPLNLAVRLQITSAIGSDPYTVTGIVSDDLSRFIADDIQVGDSLYVLDGSFVYVLAITSITSVVGPTIVFVANDPNNAGISLPTGQAAVIRPTTNYKLPTYISGLRDDLRSAIMNRQAQLIDNITGGGVASITDFISAGAGVPPSASASANGGETWRNMTTGELWGSNGSIWYPYTRGPKECQDTVLVSAVTIQSGGSLITGSPLVRNSSGVWEHMYNHPSGTNLIPDGVVTDIITGPRAIIQYCGVRKGSGATPNTNYYVDQTVSTGFTTTKPATNIRPLGKVANNGDFLINAGLTFLRDNATAYTQKIDNARLQGISIKVPAQGLSANESVTNYGFNSVNGTYYRFNTIAQGNTSTEYGGWLANGVSGDSIAVRAPYSVIIGDSQAEGHPNAHGRLHPAGVATYTPTTPDVFGTISFKLRALTKMRWFNHGIGGQTTTQVWARWSRDVLAQTYDAGDGRGSRTLPTGTKPVTVIVIAGINDPYSGINAATTISNLENMAKSARDNGIAAVFLNMPGDTIITQAQLKTIDTLNTYFASGALQGFGASIVDYNTWWKQGSAWQDNSHKGRWITDDIHPSAAGYDTLATYIFQQSKLPVLDSIIVYNEIGPGSFTGFSRPTGITLDQRSYTIPNTSVGKFKVNYGLSSDSVFIKIVSSTNVSGTTYSGFSHILFKIANDTVGLSTRRQIYQAYQGANGSVWSKSATQVYPTTITNKVGIGTSINSNNAYLTVKSPLNTGNYIASFQSSSNSNVLSVLDNNRVIVNATSLGNYNFGVNGTAYIQNTAGTEYNFFNGSTWEMWGTTPLWKMQSTGVNTGGTGYTEFRMSFTGAEVRFQPSTAAQGIDVPINFYNKSGSIISQVDLLGNKIQSNVTHYFNSVGAQMRLRADGTNSNDGGLFIGGTGAITLSNWNVNRGLNILTSGIFEQIGTTAFKPAVGTTAQAPTAVAGYLRFNNTTNQFTGSRDGSTYENFLMSSGSVATLMREESFTSTSGQTAFTIAYSAPAVSGTSVPIRVYRNGVRLFYVASAPTTTQFTYSGTTVTTAANTTGDIITIEYLN